MDFYGFLWEVKNEGMSQLISRFIDFYGFLWISMVLYGPLRALQVHMCTCDGKSRVRVRVIVVLL